MEKGTFFIYQVIIRRLKIRGNFQYSQQIELYSNDPTQHYYARHRLINFKARFSYYRGIED